MCPVIIGSQKNQCGLQYAKSKYLDRSTTLHSPGKRTCIACLPRVARANGTYEMGLQLYTVRDPMAADPIGTLRKIAVVGYRDLETYGFDAERVSYYGFGAKELKRILDDNNLADRLNRIGEQTRKAGLGLAYHNHDFEFIRRATNTGDLPHSTRASSKAAFLAVIG